MQLVQYRVGTRLVFSRPPWRSDNAVKVNTVVVVVVVAVFVVVVVYHHHSNPH